MQKYKMIIAYQGTNYSGWQIQPNSLSIQELIENALEMALKEKIRIIGSGRTDAGVHARGQVAHFSTETALTPSSLQSSLNGILPADIRILGLSQENPNFHAQRSALRKIYHYNLWLETVMDPFLTPFRTHIRRRLDLELLKEATLHFVGKKDFVSFANVRGGTCTTVRTIFRLEVIPQEGGVRLEFEGDGFLYKMVRNIVGVLLDVASGKMAADEIPLLLAARDRKCASIAASPKGLFLMEVIYGSNNDVQQNFPLKLKAK